jgi:hypothetical protein
MLTFGMEKLTARLERLFFTMFTTDIAEVKEYFL